MVLFLHRCYGALMGAMYKHIVVLEHTPVLDAQDDPVCELPCGVGMHPLLLGIEPWRVRHALTNAGLFLVDYLLERMNTGVDPDTGKHDPWERWTGLTWDEVAMALRIRAHAQARPQARPEHVDLDAPGGARWPWETERA